jgi:hypothetical protein
MSPESSRTVWRHVRAAFTEQLGYKAAALFFALVLWLVVSAEEPTQAVVAVQFIADFDSMRVLTSRRPVIHARVEGRARELIKLAEQPLFVRRIIPADAPDSVAIDLAPDDINVPAGVAARVSDVQPRSVALSFDVSTSRRVPVRSQVEITGEGSDSARIEPDTVVIIGARRVVDRLDEVRTIATTLVLRDTLPHSVGLDTARLGAGVRVQPGFVTVRLLRMPLSLGRPQTSARRDSAAGPEFR